MYSEKSFFPSKRLRSLVELLDLTFLTMTTLETLREREVSYYTTLLRLCKDPKVLIQS